MARPSYLWIPGLTVLALSACSGTSNDFFSNAPTGAGGSGHAGSSSQAGSLSLSGSPGSASSAGQSQAGASSGGAQAGGASSAGRGGATSNGGASSGGAASSGGSAGRAGGGSGAVAGHAGEKGTAGAGGAIQTPTCTELIKQASEELEAARVCRLDLDALQCTGKVTNLCNCQVPVQRSESPETKAYLRTLKQIEDKHCAVACAAVLCTSVSNADCRGSGSSVRGTCVATNHGPGPD